MSILERFYTKFVRSWCPWALSAVAVIPLSAAFGDLKSGYSAGNWFPPVGWVYVDKYHGKDGLTYSGDDYYVIMDLNKAPFGATAEILTNSKIPSGWVKVGRITIEVKKEEKKQESKDERRRSCASKERLVITCLNGASNGMIAKALLEYGDPVPFGWHILPEPTRNVSEKDRKEIRAKYGLEDGYTLLERNTF